ncbi:hypothetical protein A9Q76_02035 [Arcobacter sp. 31_11_sub10_T18]|nr:hypothetical protein A9Q76_02035 [Arcobacter sp. 31_11_sub10_T18]
MKKLLLVILLSTSFLSASSTSLGMKFFIKGQYSKALPHFVKASNAGNKQAQFYLANMYEKGLGVKKNKKLASKIYKIYAKSYKIKTQLIARPINTYKKKILKQNTVKRKVIKKKIVKKKVARKVKKKAIVHPKTANGKSYSKRLKKFYNPDLQGPEEITFD